MDSDGAPVAVKPSILRVLREKLAAQIDSAASMVEMDQPLAMYVSEDIQGRQHAISVLERTFGVSIDASAFDQLKTVGDLAQLVAVSKMGRRAGKRVYIVVYRTDKNQVVEEYVRADNHEAAVESLREGGLVEVLSVQREEAEDEDERRYRSRRRGLSGCLIVLLFAALAAGVVFYVWFRHRGFS